ncbi:hypothetical protein AAG570_004956 [Ranatra chinensis]|uniref:C2H2-type domain-containing protein n=1 Tax=Ranatra chinensis TaxID=642074 RepID=A0ABD0XZ15_9HEMI
MSENACPGDGVLCEEAPGSAESVPSGGGKASEGSRRGRPKAATITSLILEGATSMSAIRCEVCSRVFPRDKSLQAHRRVHTGERPYSCDYPGCMRKFKQSGQLKTHQRLHTGERPFLCSVQGCENRFTHANRHCAKHPGSPLVRCESSTLKNEQQLLRQQCGGTESVTNQSQEVQEWLIRYMTERRESKFEKKEKNGGGKTGNSEDYDWGNRTSSGGEEDTALAAEGERGSDDSDGGKEALPVEYDGSAVEEAAVVATQPQLPPTTDLLSDMTNLNDERTRPPPNNNRHYHHHHHQVPQQMSTVCAGSPLVPQPLLSRLSPLRSSPIRSSPLRSSPLRSSPLRSSPLRSSGALRVLLRSPVKSPLGNPDPDRLRPVKNLFSDLDRMTSPRKRELPKKRWLRIASREQEQNPNQCRPTVLRLSGCHLRHQQVSSLAAEESSTTVAPMTPLRVAPWASTAPSPMPPPLQYHQSLAMPAFPTPPYSADKTSSGCYPIQESSPGLTSPGGVLSDFEDELALPLDHFASPPQQHHLLF